MKNLAIILLLLLLTGCVKQSVNLGAKETKYNIGDFKKIVKADFKDKIEVEFKNKNLKISRWDDEVNLELEFKDDKKTNKEVKIYDITEGEGGIEFEIDLLEKPDNNIIEFNLNIKGLNFFYQPSLTEEFQNGYNDKFQKDIVVTETQVKDLAGNILVNRPENIVGSYAVYTSENKINYVGGKLYRTGQVGMIYRPKIIDLAGAEIWGVLNIDVKVGILTVTIPQNFLDNAVYPIRHAAGLTIGYTTVGGTGQVWGSNSALGSLVSTEVVANGTVDSISILCQQSLGTQTKGFITGTDYTILANGIGGAATCPVSKDWAVSIFSTPPNVVNGTNYYPWAVIDNNITMYYNNGSGTNTQYELDNNFTTPTNPSSVSNAAQQYSVYATYTESGTPPSTEVMPDDDFYISDE